MSGFELSELKLLLPTLFPAAYGLLLLVFVPVFQRDRWLWRFAVGGMAFTILWPAVLLAQWTAEEAGYDAAFGMVRVDHPSLWLDVIFAVSGLLALLIMPRYLERMRAMRAEVYPLLFFAVSGMTVMVSTNNLVMIFVGLEVLSIALYVITGLAREQLSSVEAALKYFLLGAFSTGFLVYGIALVYGATGRLDLPGIAAVLSFGLEGLSIPLLLAGLAFIIVAFAFKVGAAPFHFWVPDVYQGAPTPVTAFMAAGTKAAAFGILLRILHTGFEQAAEPSHAWINALSVLAVLTMILGNLLALAQDRVKRLLAYSSVAHAGYLMLGLIAPAEVGAKNVVFYLLVYALMTIGAFAVIALFQEEGGEDADHISHLAGLWQKRPALALTMGVFMFSMIGIPPMGGFTGKYVIFLAALKSGHPYLAAVMALAAVVGAAYYLRVIIAMFFRNPERAVIDDLKIPLPVAVALGVAVVGTLLLGIMPSLVLDPLSGIGLSLLLP